MTLALGEIQPPAGFGSMAFLPRGPGVCFGLRSPPLMRPEPQLGTTQDALTRAQVASQRRPSAESSGDTGPRAGGEAIAGGGLAQKRALKSKLLGLDRNGQVKRLLLIHTAEDAGEPGHARRLAASLAGNSDLRILVLDLSRWALSFREAFGGDQPTGLFDLFSGGHTNTSPIQKVGPGELYTARLTADYPRLIDFFESDEAESFFSSLGANFDFVLLEIPGGAPFSECRTLCSQADAVALVVEAGIGADQLALDARRLLESPAEKLVGLIVQEPKTRRRRVGPLARVALATVLLFGFAFWLGGLSGGGSVGPVVVSALRAPLDSPLSPGSKTLVESLQIEPPEIEPPEIETPVIEPLRVEPPLVEPRDAIEEPAPQAEPPGSAAEPVKAADARPVVVAAGDNLYRIILANYGVYSDDLVGLVLEANPEISSAGQIAVGQTIRLPRLD